MKGCLSFIIKTIIAVLVFFGLVHLGAIDWIKNKISEYQNPSQERMIEQTKDIIDLSEIDDEYNINKNLKILKHRMIIAEHGSSNQKMIMIEPNNEEILTKEDIKSNKIEEKLKTVSKKYSNKLIQIDNIKVLKKGEFKGIDQTIPYAKIQVEISNLPIKDMTGIVGVAELKDGKNLIVISANEKNKYSQIITEAFYKQVKQ